MGCGHKGLGDGNHPTGSRSRAPVWVWRRGPQKLSNTQSTADMHHTFTHTKLIELLQILRPTVAEVEWACAHLPVAFPLVLSAASGHQGHLRPLRTMLKLYYFFHGSGGGKNGQFLRLQGMYLSDDRTIFFCCSRCLSHFLMP